MLHPLTKNFSPISHICPIGLLKKTPKRNSNSSSVGFVHSDNFPLTLPPLFSLPLPSHIDNCIRAHIPSVHKKYQTVVYNMILFYLCKN